MDQIHWNNLLLLLSQVLCGPLRSSSMAREKYLSHVLLFNIFTRALWPFCSEKSMDKTRKIKESETVELWVELKHVASENEKNRKITNSQGCGDGVVVKAAAWARGLRVDPNTYVLGRQSVPVAPLLQGVSHRGSLGLAGRDLGSLRDPVPRDKVEVDKTGHPMTSKLLESFLQCFCLHSVCTLAHKCTYIA